MTQNNITFPIRINAYLAHKGIGTRKGADSLISQGKVFINSTRAKLGAIVQKDDVVEVKGVAQKKYLYLLWNKPRGVATPESKVLDDTKVKVFPIGRLDKETDGLILLSNDTRLSERLLNPKYNHEKEYEVSVREDIVPIQLQRLTSGVKIAHEGKRVLVKAKKVEKIERHILGITLTEGRKHQIRQMCSAVHLTINNLRRIRIGDLKLGKLRKDQIQSLSEKQISELRASVGLM